MKASPNTLELQSILDQVIPWARETFPRATPASIAEHLRREAVELAADPTNAEEMADVQILLHELVVYTGTDLAEAVKTKFAANMRRTWGPVDRAGVQEHVRERQSWDDYFFAIARVVATRATCPRAAIGAVLVRHKRILATGFNGAPDGEIHCPSEGEALVKHLNLTHCDRARHAERNALMNTLGPVFGATLFVVGQRRVCPDCGDRLREQGVTDVRWMPS